MAGSYTIDDKNKILVVIVKNKCAIYLRIYILINHFERCRQTTKLLIIKINVY